MKITHVNINVIEVLCIEYCQRNSGRYMKNSV